MRPKNHDEVSSERLGVSPIVFSLLVGVFALACEARATAQDFATKCAAAGVLHCFDFDSRARLFFTWPTGTVCDATFAGQTRYSISGDRSGPGNVAATVQNGQCVFPDIDTSLKHSGAGSLHFTIGSNTGANSSGWFAEVFQRNAGGSFGYIAPGSPLGNIVYMQWYQYFDSNFLDTNYICTNGSCGGWKQIIWYGNPPNGASASSIEVTNNNGWQRGVPQVYGQIGQDDYGIQDVRGCPYMGSGFSSRVNYTEPPCVRYKANRWMEFTMRVEVRGVANAQQSRVQLWVDGQLSVDMPTARINWGGSDGEGLGQYQITPYHTNKDSSQSHPVGHTWYDDLIVSTQPIPMNGGGLAPNPPTNLTAQ